THARPTRRCVIGALVGTPGFLDRVHTHAEAGADARELERRAQERLAQVLAVGAVVARAEMHRAQVLSLVHELSGEEASSPHGPPTQVIDLVDHREVVALAEIAMEIDI